MNRLTIPAMLSVLLLFITSNAFAGPEEDLQAYQEYFSTKFPDLTAVDMSNGMYNFNADKRAQWDDIMSFPPYEIAIDEGKELFNTPFKNGKKYSDCLEKGGIGIAHLLKSMNAG
jgi:sulfur-oxidizing protein SoxA